MNYLATDKPCPRGEVLVRGANVFLGYFKNEKATAECLDEKDGWFSTGDIGRWNANGTLSIIDRKKNIFKLSQGEYIAAEKIELVYAKAPTVGQIWVYGNSYKSFVLAVVVPAADVIAKHCVAQGWWPSTEAPQPGTEKFAQDFQKVWEGPNKAALKDHVLHTMREYEKELKGFEVLKDILIEYKIDNMLAGFTEANECLTPTFKLRRPYLLKRYKDALKDLYEKHGEPNKPDEKWPGEP
jgi:long-chain acyl-CoA synthetase